MFSNKSFGFSDQSEILALEVVSASMMPSSTQSRANMKFHFIPDHEHLYYLPTSKRDQDMIPKVELRWHTPTLQNYANLKSHSTSGHENIRYFFIYKCGKASYP